jgi:hypothetical protein
MNDYDDRVDAERLRLWTAVTSGLIVYPQVIYEHGELRWNDIDRRNPLIRPPELWQSYQQSRLVAKLEDLAKEINFTLGSISFIL